MADGSPGWTEKQTDGFSEMMELLHIDVQDQEELQGTPERDPAHCSKNVLRKQRHWQRQLAAKKSRRKEEKLRRKLNREFAPPQQSKRVMKAITRERLAEARSSGLKVCIDLSMTHCMSDKEVSRLSAQLRRLYGSNKKALQPFHLFLTDLREDSRLLSECVRMNAGFLDYSMEITQQSCLDIFPPQSLVYLSPDAEEALDCVERDKVYVLGGLVDESVQKTLSLCRAKELGVRVVRLPIDEYMQKKHNDKNFHSKILAINQVLDIMLTLCETGSWTHALSKWFPQGKGYVVAPHFRDSISPNPPLQCLLPENKIGCCNTEELNCPHNRTQEHL
uniref:tRNA methyltransferase 10 homolog B isoform X2 n=1 Tax=Doryrhamphus excisus TaxID=161450 RepID=UPI0025ADDFC9|nr:tRNA methyltransferase 10 homolog B isoform X2 [Doryrhamphus excisus]